MFDGYKFDTMHKGCSLFFLRKKEDQPEWEKKIVMDYQVLRKKENEIEIRGRVTFEEADVPHVIGSLFIDKLVGKKLDDNATFIDYSNFYIKTKDGFEGWIIFVSETTSNKMSFNFNFEKDGEAYNEKEYCFYGIISTLKETIETYNFPNSCSL